MKIESLLKKLYIALVILFLYLPLIVLVVFSFNKAQYSSQWNHFTLQWFIQLVEDDYLIQSLKNSIFLGILSAFISTSISVIAATVLIFQNNKKNIKSFLMVPSFLIILPDLILGVGFLMILNLLHIPFGFISLLIAHITFCMPFIIFTIINQINSFDIHLYYASLDLGATKFQTWKKIILPLLAPSLFSAFLLAFTLSFDDVVISYFVAGPEFNILPLTIFSMIRSGATPEINALCTLTLLFSFMLILLTQSKMRKS
jgi:spermidine/putrescine transport system permease protein